MESIEVSDLKLSGIDIEGTFLDFGMEILPNCHAYAKAVIRFTQEPDLNQLTQFENLKLVISAEKTVLFAGCCKEFSIKKDTVYHTGTLELKLVSASWMADRKKEKCSFQDIKMDYHQIMTKVLEKSKSGLEYCVQNKNQDMPLIQYNETAWEFVRRLASRLNSCIYPHYRKTNPVIMVGILSGGDESEISCLENMHSFSQRYWKVRQEENVARRDDYIYYDITSYENHEIGDYLKLDGVRNVIVSKKAYVKRGELIFSYEVGSPAVVSMTRYNNPAFAGLSIQGEVLSTAKETVRIRFNFDKEQDEATAYDYMWVPESGNMMYLMPRKGTTVNLFFKNESEESAVAVSCIRTNGKSYEKMSDCKKRYLTNEYDKQMSLKPDGIAFLNQNTGDGIVVHDVSGMEANSSDCITLVSQKKINVEAKNIYISTPNEILLKKVSL